MGRWPLRIRYGRHSVSSWSWMASQIASSRMSTRRTHSTVKRLVDAVECEPCRPVGRDSGRKPSHMRRCRVDCSHRFEPAIGGMMPPRDDQRASAHALGAWFRRDCHGHAAPCARDLASASPPHDGAVVDAKYSAPTIVLPARPVAVESSRVNRGPAAPVACSNRRWRSHACASCMKPASTADSELRGTRGVRTPAVWRAKSCGLERICHREPAGHF